MFNGFNLQVFRNTLLLMLLFTYSQKRLIERMMELFKAFKEFAFRGNVIDLAVGVILGAAFTAIINSLVQNIFTPLLGILIGGIDVQGLTVKVGDATLGYGMFLQSTIEFVLIAFALFLFVKGITSFRKKEDPVEEAPTTEEKLLMEIRDALLQANHPKIDQLDK